MSRTALREAYSMLSAKALIVARPKIGTRVRPKSDWNLLDPEVLAWHLQATPSEHFVDDLFVLRQMVEPAAAALAASAPSRATIDRIADAYGRMERFKNGAGDLIGADLDFHMAILEATGNHFLAALGGLIHAALECTFRLSWQGAARIQDDRLHQHRAIFEAIRDGAAGARAGADGRAPARFDRGRARVPEAAERGRRTCSPAVGQPLLRLSPPPSIGPNLKPLRRSASSRHRAPTKLRLRPRSQSFALCGQTRGLDLRRQRVTNSPSGGYVFQAGAADMAPSK